MNRQMRRFVAAVALALAPIGLALVWLVVREDLPGRLATHFGLDGTPDGFQPAGVFAAWLLPLTFAMAAAGIVLVARLRVPGVPIVVGVFGYMTWLFAAIGADTLLSARGVVDPRDIRSGAAHLVPVILLAVAAGLLLWRLTPPGPRPEGPAGRAPVYPVAPGERVVWLGSASSTLLGRIAGALMLAGLLLLALAWLVSGDALPALLTSGGAVLLAGLATGWCRSVHVRVDNDGVVARLGGMPWPVFRTPIERIEDARAELIEPLAWGGWGYRLSRRGSAIVVRRGPGVVLRRTGRADLAITVDDAETAAAVVNGLVDVRR